jgi:hypothetical protein
MATLDEINILDRVKTDPQLLLQAGRQPTVERVKPTFNPASDYFYNNVLNDSGRRMVDFASSIVNDPFNFAASAGMIGKANKARQGIASLDESSRIQRAKDMGFRTDEPVYHGTHSKDINEFNDKFIGNRDEGFFGKGHYFTSGSGEASYYGPNVGEYFTRGKLLDLSQTTKNSNFEMLDKDYFKFWTKELDKIDMLDEPTKKGLKTINKIDDYCGQQCKSHEGAKF